MGMLSRLCLIALALLGIASPGLAVPGSQGPASGIRPEVVHPAPNRQSGTAGRIFDVPRGFETSLAHVEDLKHYGPPQQALGGREIVYDTNTGSDLQPFAAAQGVGFPGLLQNGFIPYDGAIAVGPRQILVMTNSQFAVYDKATGAQLYMTQFGPFFGAAGGGGFDPKCFYDAAGHFVLMVVERNASARLGLIDIAVSQTSDATGPYYKYSFDATVTGTVETNTWADYPSLGYDETRIYVGSNQYSFGNSFQFAKVRAFSKAQLYSGGPATYVDFANILLADGSKAFTVKAARNLSRSAVGHFLATRPAGGSLVTTWTITGTFPALARSAPRTVLIGSYAVPPDAAQPGTPALIATGDCRTQDVVWQNGSSYTAFSERVGTKHRTYTNAIRYLQISDPGVAVRDITYTAAGIDMYYPAVSVDRTGNAVIVFGRSSGSQYASMYQTRLRVGGTIEASTLVKGGISTNTSGRWGDFNGVANDPANANTIWGYAGWANSSNRWATWIVALAP